MNDALLLDLITKAMENIAWVKSAGDDGQELLFSDEIIESIARLPRNLQVQKKMELKEHFGVSFRERDFNNVLKDAERRLSAPPELSPSGLPIVHYNGMDDIPALKEHVINILAENNGESRPKLVICDNKLAKIIYGEEKNYIQLLDRANIASEIAKFMQFIKVKSSSFDYIYPPLELCIDLLASGYEIDILPKVESLIPYPILLNKQFIKAGIADKKILHIPTFEKFNFLELKESVKIIKELFSDFPFDSEASWANFVALLLTPIVRDGINIVPVAIIDSPQIGTGKSLLAEALLLIYLGEASGIIPADLTQTTEELRKRLTSLLISGQRIISIDNVMRKFNSSLIASLVTSTIFQDRLLGTSEMLTIRQNITLVINGNNVEVGDDLNRRSYRIRLNAEMAKPWLRTGFTIRDFRNHILENRKQILDSLLSIVGHWVKKKSPVGKRRNFLGGFEIWSETISDILDNAGIPNFLANLAEGYEVMDEAEHEWETFLLDCHERSAAGRILIRDVLKWLEEDAGFQEIAPSSILKALKNKQQDTSRSLAWIFRRESEKRFGDSQVYLKKTDEYSRNMKIWEIVLSEKYEKKTNKNILNEEPPF